MSSTPHHRATTRSTPRVDVQRVITAPQVLVFQSDAIACATVCTLGHFRAGFLTHDAPIPPDLPYAVLVSSEELVRCNLVALARPNIRVIALADDLWPDRRLHEAVYGYLPRSTPAPLIERMVENAIAHVRLLATRRDLNSRLTGATGEIRELHQIGAALSAEHDTEKLLELILTKSRQLAQADAGSIYLVESVEGEAQPSGEKVLRFKLAQNDSVRFPFREFTIPISDHSIAGYVAQHGETVSINDAYRLPPDTPFTVNRRFDEESAYRTKSILAVPMRKQDGEVIGVVQLINSKRNFDQPLTSPEAVTEHVVPFSEEQRIMLESLASQAAVAYENSQLYASIHRLFEGFVKASVSAIEVRDPTTSGHSLRVATLTIALAEAVDRIDEGVYAATRFTRTQMRELRYASLLHDFGKVAVPESVLVKAKKLYPHNLEVIRQRFDFIKRILQAQFYRDKCELLERLDRDDARQRYGQLEIELQDKLASLEQYYSALVEANEPTILPEGTFDHLARIAQIEYPDLDGSTRHLLTPEEVHLLSIRKGSLAEEERASIESHVVHTYNFLKQIPWTSDLRSIPDIAVAHHEKLNGTGYPRRLNADQIPVQVRMMTIADIFDALSASDRPYKKAVSPQRALEIIQLEVDDGQLDSALYQIFVESRAYERSRDDAAFY